MAAFQSNCSIGSVEEDAKGRPARNNGTCTRDRLDMLVETLRSGPLTISRTHASSEGDVCTIVLLATVVLLMVVLNVSGTPINVV